MSLWSYFILDIFLSSLGCAFSSGHLDSDWMDNDKTIGTVWKYTHALRICTASHLATEPVI